MTHNLQAVLCQPSGSGNCVEIMNDPTFNLQILIYYQFKFQDTICKTVKLSCVPHSSVVHFCSANSMPLLSPVHCIS